MKLCPIYDGRKYDKRYWKLLIPVISLYSFMEGTRWMRGIDYPYNLRISKGIQDSGDLAYDTFAHIIIWFGLPYWFFFIAISCLLIYAILKYFKDFSIAIIPVSIMVYSWSMGQSENLMRQYAALSLMLIGIYDLLHDRYIKSLGILGIAYLTHSSVVFIVPFLVIAIVICYVKNMKKIFIIEHIDIFFLILYFSSSILSIFFSDILNDLIQLANIGIADKYLEENYITLATANENFVYESAEYTLLQAVRETIRYIFVIIVGYRFYLLKKMSSKLSRLYFITWFIACCGIVYMASLPKLEMEVIERLGLYLQVFVFYIEGVLFYYYVRNSTSKFDPYSIFINKITLLLIVMEAIPILKWNVGGVLGKNFMWLE